jgi:hypothetical protein
MAQGINMAYNLLQDVASKLKQGSPAPRNTTTPGASHFLGGGFQFLIVILIFIPIFKPTGCRRGLATKPKAPEDWRTPKRFALFASRQTTRQRHELPRKLSGPLFILTFIPLSGRGD